MMKRFHFLACMFALCAGCSRQPPAGLNSVPKRIISLAPDITESLYLLGLGDRIVGATTYCLWPEEAKQIPRVGGFGQYNFEAIVSLRPDLVILHHNYESEKNRLTDLGIPYLETGTEHMADIIRSIQTIGDACGVAAAAEALTAQIREQIAGIRKPNNAPRVLITFGGDPTQIEQIFAFGADCLHHELLELAGGINVISNKLAFSTLSKEAVIRLNPDIIIQMAPGTEAPENPPETWKDYAGISAVRHNRIYVLTGDYTCIPGPRFTRILSDFKDILTNNE
ncbi:hypothetical protein EGM51_10235 [Verrucomicrobia bacterium S94]|nr:hypothetical protein EGM51_10235 [Verrucomicrobia bacterium S94]